MTRYSPLILMPIALLATGAFAETVFFVHSADEDLTAVTFRAVDGAVSQSTFSSGFPSRPSALDIRSFFTTTPQDFPLQSASRGVLQEQSGNFYQTLYDHEGCMTEGCFGVDPDASFGVSSILLSTGSGHGFSAGSTALTGCTEFDLSGLGFTAADLGSGGDVFAYGQSQVSAIVGQWALDNGPPPFELKLSGIAAANDDQAGRSVAIAGDTVLIGAPGRDRLGGSDNGWANVFDRFGNGACAQGEALFPGDTMSFDTFGRSVALSGDTAVIGTPNKDVVAGAQPVTDAGAAYVFTRSGGVWSEQQKLTAGPEAESQSRFGERVAIEGDTVLIGARQAAHGGLSNPGAAYVFTRSGGVWTQQQKLTAGGDAQAFAQFGESVALSGDTAVIGSPSKDAVVGGSISDDVGAAYVFTRSGGAWSLEQKLTAGPDAEDNAQFGASVALDGDTALIGALTDDRNAPAGFRPGAAYVFTRSGGAWSIEQKLTAGGDAEENAEFGARVALSGVTAVIGSPDKDAVAGGQLFTDAGAAYVFTRSGGVWSEQTKLTAGDAGQGALFGGSVALSGCTVAAGARGIDSGQGAAYLFDLTAVDDDDGDGICGAADNCTQIVNPDQRDSNGDGFGNACDPDLNNDNVVDFGDLPAFQSAFFSQDGDPNWNPDADINSDGVVDFADLPPFQNLFFGPPGPSGLAP